MQVHDVIAGNLCRDKLDHVLHRVKELIDTYGICIIEGAFSKKKIQPLKSAADERLAELLRLLLLKSALACRNGFEPESARYKEVVERDGARFDCRFKMEEEPFGSFQKESLFSRIAETLLGDEAYQMFYGFVAALGMQALSSCEGENLGDQQWHQDGGSLFPSVHCPLHCFNIFIPLNEMDGKNGATEFIARSHTCVTFEEASQKSKDCVFKPYLEIGSIALFDYRLWHRGTQNQTDADRHILYVTYAKNWFRDKRNHQSTSSIKQLVFNSGKMLKAKPSSTENDSERCQGIVLNSKRKATLEALRWKREVRSYRERFLDDFVYEFDGDKYPPLTISQNTGGIHSTVWDSSIVLAKYFELNPGFVKGCSCVGLGSGCGLTEAVAAFLGASFVHFTDLEYALPLLKCNAEKVEDKCPFLVSELRWGQMRSIEYTEKKYDVIIGTDIMYIEESVEPLVQTLNHLSHKKSKIFLAYGRNRAFLKQFLNAAARNSIRFTQVPFNKHHRFYCTAEVDILLGYKE